MSGTGNVIVDKMQGWSVSGTVIPMQWFKTIVKESTGKAYMNAIVILSDIVYWYRPQEVRDEQSGMVVGAKKRFKADLLQRSYQQFADQFGITKRDAYNAIVALENIGVVKRHFRTVLVGGHTRMSNVLFVELVPEKLFELTDVPKKSENIPLKTGGTITQKKEEVLIKNGVYAHGIEVASDVEEAVAQNGQTNTKITTENTTDISGLVSCGGCSKPSITKSAPAREGTVQLPPQPKQDNVKRDEVGAVRKCYSDNIHPLCSPIETEKLDELTERYSAPWVMSAITEAVENNARRMRYIEAVLKAWAERGGRRGGQRPNVISGKNQCAPKTSDGWEDEGDEL